MPSAARISEHGVFYKPNDFLVNFHMITFFFIDRLQYFARGVQGYMNKLRESLQDKGVDQLKDEEGRIKVTALRTTSNINSLIRDLFRNPPSYKAMVTLSFKPANASQVSYYTLYKFSKQDVIHAFLFLRQLSRQHL